MMVYNSSNKHYRAVGLLLWVFLVACSQSSAFIIRPTGNGEFTKVSSSSYTALCMAAKSKKKKKAKATGGTVGIKGFGASTSGGSGSGSSSSGSSSNSSSNANGVIDRSKEALAFYDYIEKNGGGANLKRVALGHFPLGDNNNDITIRGVVALRPIKKGELILGIPYEAALNLGREGDDPTLPAATLLEHMCTNRDNPDMAPYLRMLPVFQGSDCMGSTDFFSDDALDTLQCPIVRDETLSRREAVLRRWEDSADTMSSLTWQNDSPITEQYLAYAVWLITSRVLTVQGPQSLNASFRLMIPFIDMCNHDRKSAHILSGRAEPGGMLKVIAGSNIMAGEQVNICYGGGVAGNDRFIQDYGFLDWDEEAYSIVARQLLGRQRVVEGRGGSLVERERTLDSLKMTSLEKDEELLLKGGAELASDVKAALEFRIGIKKSLVEFDQM